MSISPVGSVSYGWGSSPALISGKAGDIFVGYIEVDPANATVTSISSPHGTWSRITATKGSDGKWFSLWLCKITHAVHGSITMKFSGSPGSASVESGFQEFRSTMAKPGWEVSHSAFQNNKSGNTIPFPAFTVVNAGQLYWGYGETTSVASTPVTSGYSYSVTPESNIVVYRASCPKGKLDPVAATSAASGSSISCVIGGA